MEVAVITVASQPLVISKDLPGRIAAYRTAEIRPQVSGIIVERLFEEGSNVKKGQMLYQIDPAPYEAAYQQAQAALLKAEANIKSLRAKAERYEEVVKVSAISRQERDDTFADFAQGEADIALAKASLLSAKINLDYTKVFSPISGRIGQSLVTEGALVTANQASPMAIVQQFDQIYVDVMQPVGEFMKLQKQNETLSATEREISKAKLIIDGNVYGENGVIQFADAKVHQNTGMIQIRTLFPNPKGLFLPGLFVHVRLAQYAEENAILVPQQAVIRQPNGEVIVWALDQKNKVFQKKIQVGEIVNNQWRVTQGLKPGDRIVLEGVMKIASGTTVIPVESDRT
ncbi:MAG: efflux RND transporter periplasmic adaptor subunit [Candidatus Cloacimonetes bacterium]|nr:efflux RND transporter periplasmic adaptor subunit [Candidatus Cloacimonadota bacterium]